MRDKTRGAIRIRNIVTGEDREVIRNATFAYCLFEARGLSLFCLEPSKTGDEALMVALDSLRIEKLGIVPERSSPTEPNPIESGLLEKKASSSLRGPGLRQTRPHA